MGWASAVASDQDLTALKKRFEAFEQLALSNSMPDPRGSKFGASNLAQVLLAMEPYVVTVKSEHPTQEATVDDFINTKLTMAVSKRSSTQEGSSWFKFGISKSSHPRHRRSPRC